MTVCVGNVWEYRNVPINVKYCEESQTAQAHASIKRGIIVIAFDEGERIPNRVLDVLCHTARKIRDFSVMGRRQISPPPP